MEEGIDNDAGSEANGIFRCIEEGRTRCDLQELDGEEVIEVCESFFGQS